MDDFISRQAAIDKADSLYRDTKNDECYMITGYNHAISDIRAILKSLPSAQPDIIRCKDCKHWRFDHTCREHSLVSPMMANEFCSRAERRNDG